jgi:hypothetical protein
VVDPPRANPKPVAPNRLLLLAGALALALVSGVFATLRPASCDRCSMTQTICVTASSCPSWAS